MTQIEAFIEHYNNRRYHENLNKGTLADASFGRAPATLKQRERIKQQTMTIGACKTESSPPNIGPEKRSALR